MGRKRKVYGSLFEEDGKTFRYHSYTAKWPPFVRPAPRGNTGRLYPFTSTVKELAPMVYAYLVDQLRKPERERDPMVHPVLAEYRTASRDRRKRPTAKEVTAFVMERSLEGAWQVWGIKRPFSEGDADTFLRRYVRGHKGALRDFRQIVREPQPWPPFHRCHWLKHFFGAKGEAAREFNLLAEAVNDCETRSRCI